MRWIIESKAGCSVEIDEPGNFLRKAAADGTQFLACKRVPHKHRTFDVKRLHHRKNVIPEVVRRVVAVGRCGFARCAKPSSRNAVDVMLPGEPRSEAVEAMRGISRPCEEDERSAGAAPIQNFKLNTLFDSDQLDLMRRGVHLGNRMYRKQECGTQEKGNLPSLTHRNLLEKRSNQYVIGDGDHCSETLSSSPELR